MPRSYRFLPRVFRLDPSLLSGPRGSGADPVDALLVALGDLSGLAVLDSCGGAPRDFSILAFEPLEFVGPGVNDLDGLRAFAGRLRTAGGEPDLPGPFHGGFLGALSYELGIAGEGLELPRDRFAVPPIVGGLYCDFVVLDHRAGHLYLVLGEEPGDARPPVLARRTDVERRLRRTEGEAVQVREAAAGVRTVEPLRRRVSAVEHGRRIDALRARIAVGELYQANLAHSFEAPIEGCPRDLYRRLRKVNPAPYAGYLAWNHAETSGAVLSASPELLVEYDGRRARTRPIKGTIARGADEEQDRSQRARLLASEKDLAELAMIVDLERNDLGRIAEVGSVQATYPVLESYAAVHHLVGEVDAKPLPEIDAFGILGSLFPGGSITGAPKIASMRAIAELELEGRGFFTGSLGFVDTRGHALFNILIRTLVWRPLPEGRGDSGASCGSQRGEVSFHVGGGITFSSDPAAEDRETLDKGAALAAALGGDIQALGFPPLSH